MYVGRVHVKQCNTRPIKIAIDEFDSCRIWIGYIWAKSKQIEVKSNTSQRRDEYL